MDRRLLGGSLLAFGVALVGAGAVLLVTGGGDAAGDSAAEARTVASTSLPPATAAPPTIGSTSTTSSTAVATTAVPPEMVEDFVIAFRVAVDAEDVAFLMERLHPIVLEVFGEKLCRAFIEREILQLENYVQAGPVEGPTTRSFETPSGSGEAVTFSVPVEFVFQGQHFEDTARYGPVDGEMHWFTECR
jgi:hypothetical protein